MSLVLADGNGVSVSRASTVTPFYSSSSFWNTPIPSNPEIDPNSANMVSNSLMPYSSTGTFNNTDWGIGYTIGTSSDPIFKVACTEHCGQGSSFTVHVPASARPSSGADHHLTVLNGRTEYDMGGAGYDSDTNSWSASSIHHTDIWGWGAECAQGQRCGSSVAAGFAGMGGVIRPEEVQQGHIDHALSLVIPGGAKANYIACPATSTDGRNTSPYAIPEGARLQLDPSFNVDAQNWLPWQKMVAKAMQVYGAYVSDQGDNLAWYGQTDENPGNVSWSSVGVNNATQRAFPHFPWKAVRILRIHSCN